MSMTSALPSHGADRGQRWSHTSRYGCKVAWYRNNSTCIVYHVCIYRDMNCNSFVLGAATPLSLRCALQFVLYFASLLIMLLRCSFVLGAATPLSLRCALYLALHVTSLLIALCFVACSCWVLQHMFFAVPFIWYCTLHRCGQNYAHYILIFYKTHIVFHTR